MRCEIDRNDIGKSFEYAVGVLVVAAKCSAMDAAILSRARNLASSCVYIWASGRTLSSEDFVNGCRVLQTAVAASEQLMRMELVAARGESRVSPEIAAFKALRLEKPSGLDIRTATDLEDLIKYNANGTMAALSELATRWAIHAKAMLPRPHNARATGQTSVVVPFSVPGDPKR
jgi:hypothetical protein